MSNLLDLGYMNVFRMVYIILNLLRLLCLPRCYSQVVNIRKVSNIKYFIHPFQRDL